MLTIVDFNLNLTFTLVKNYFDKNNGTVPQKQGVVYPHFSGTCEVAFEVCFYMPKLDNRHSC